MMDAEYFRASAGAVIIDQHGRVLALERSDIPGAWQFPQGGVRQGESAAAACFREVLEETGLGEQNLEVLDEYPDWLVYELPAEKRSKKTGRGQAQRWFLHRLLTSDSKINLDSSGEKEFRSFAWMTMNEMIGQTAEFRKAVYTRLSKRFAPHLK